MIISVTDIAGGGIKVEFYVMSSSGTSMDADVLERAVKVSLKNCIPTIVR